MKAENARPAQPNLFGLSVFVEELSGTSAPPSDREYESKQVLVYVSIPVFCSIATAETINW